MKNRRTRCNPKVWNSNTACVICGAIKRRILYSSGRSEEIARFLERKTCGKNTNCYRKYISGKGNPNYKGYMPKCIICGERISYNNAIDMKNGNAPRYCRKHYIDSKKGIYPEQLKPYVFHTGMIPWNKIKSL